MINPLRTPEDYELFIYTLAEQFTSIRRSTVVFVRRGATLARVAGDLYFDRDIRLVVRERIVVRQHSILIDWYGYNVWQGHEKIFWYNSQPHPNDVNLASTDSHHKHIPPDIKHHWIPAPQMSFTRPNLPVVIREIEEFIEKLPII